MEEPRIDSSCSVAILVGFSPYLLPKGRTDVGKCFLHVLLENKVSLSLATLLCVLTYKSSMWAKWMPVSFIKLLIEWRKVDISPSGRNGWFSSEPRIFVSDSL